MSRQLGLSVTWSAAAAVALLSSGCARSRELPPEPCEAGARCDCRVADRIPSGTHWVGHGEGAHRVTLTEPFYLARYEATAACYRLCVEDGACLDELPWSADYDAKVSSPATNLYEGYWKDPHNALLPILPMSWFEARRYCRWLGGRLPTNAESEKAARGEDGRAHPWFPPPDDPVDPPTDPDWCEKVHRPRTSALPECGGEDQWVMEVGSYPTGAGPYGHLDIVGNSGEWVLDWFQESSGAHEVDPTGAIDPPPDERCRTLRQGLLGGRGWERTPLSPSGRSEDSMFYLNSPFLRGTLAGVRCAFDEAPEPMPAW